MSSSLFVYPDILIDTPEGLYQRLVEFEVTELRSVFYTHWHPDHTQGMRIFETWVHSGYLEQPLKPPIDLYLPNDMVADFDRYLPMMRFLVKSQYARLVEVEDRKPVVLGDLSVTPVNLQCTDRVRYAFLLEEEGKRVMYAPCSVFGTKFDAFWQDLDVLFLEAGWPGNTQALREKQIGLDHISLEETIGYFDHLQPKQLIITHLEGAFHVTYDFVQAKIKGLPNIDVAYDGMVIEI
jgi:phosphoribosyl 1,2-cyclic phosphate phosphodiesterase